jgi:hypothetical protein
VGLLLDLIVNTCFLPSFSFNVKGMALWICLLQMRHTEEMRDEINRIRTKSFDHLDQTMPDLPLDSQCKPMDSSFWPKPIKDGFIVSDNRK